MEQVIDFVSVAFKFRNDLRKLQDGTNDLYFGWLADGDTLIPKHTCTEK